MRAGWSSSGSRASRSPAGCSATRPGRGPGPSDRRCGAALARVHSIRAGASPVCPARSVPRPLEFLDGPASSARCSSWLRWLASTGPPPAGPSVHGDYRMGNLLVGPAAWWGPRLGARPLRRSRRGPRLADRTPLAVRGGRRGRRLRGAGELLAAYAAAGGAGDPHGSSGGRPTPPSSGRSSAPCRRRSISGGRTGRSSWRRSGAASARASGTSSACGPAPRTGHLRFGHRRRVGPPTRRSAGHRRRAGGGPRGSWTR